MHFLRHWKRLRNKPNAQSDVFMGQVRIAGGDEEVCEKSENFAEQAFSGCGISLDSPGKRHDNPNSVRVGLWLTHRVYSS